MTTSDELQRRCEVARDLARRVGRQALQWRQDRQEAGAEARLKGPQDFVTAADGEAEEMLRRELSSAFPHDGFLGEESGGGQGAAGTWVVDPIDGTANFMRALPEWAVSLAHVEGGRVRLGVVYDAPHDKVYWAAEGQGAFVEDTPLRAVRRVETSRALVMLGRSNRTSLAGYIDVIQALQAHGAEHRRFGAAAMGLVRVAEGSVDAFFEASLNCWDALAGLLIAAEAGAVALAPPLQGFLAAPGPVLAGAPEIVTLLSGCVPEQLAGAERMG